MANVTTFGTLKSELLSILGRAPVDAVYQMVMADVNSELRLSIMEKTETLTECAEVSLPLDFQQMVSVYRDTDPRTALSPTSPQAIHRGYQSSGTPTEYAIVDQLMLLNPSPDGTENIEIRYIEELDNFSADSDTNDVLTRYPQIYIFGALYYHSYLIQDFEAAQGWKMAYEQAKRNAQTADDSLRYAGAPMQVRARATA